MFRFLFLTKKLDYVSIMRNTILGQFLLRPRTTGAIWPSSPSLCRTLAGEIGIEKAASVVELGPGTGAATGIILEAICPDARFFAIELNEEVAKPFRQRFPEVTLYNESAANLPALLKKENLTHVDVIVSGLPWASFPDSLQEELLDAIYAALPENGSFATFAYLQGTLLPTGMKFRKRLAKYFKSVQTSQVVWMNLPPAFVYRCTK